MKEKKSTNKLLSKEILLSILEDTNASRKALAETNDYLDNIIKSMIDTLIVVDPDAKIKRINPAAEELLGYKQDELIGKPVAIIFAEKEASIFKDTILKNLLETGIVRNYDTNYRTKKGDIIHVRFSGSVMMDKEGKLAGIVGIARDMREIKHIMQKENDLMAAADTERERTAELEKAQDASLNIMEDMAETSKALEESKTYVDNIIENMVDALIVVDPNATIQAVNNAATQMLGYEEDELVGKPVVTFFAEEEEEEEVFNKSGISDLIRKGSVRNLERTYVTKKGRKIPVLFSGSVMRNNDGRILGLICMAVDITERKRAEEKLKTMQAKINQMDKLAATGQLGAGLAHEINNPLAIITGFAQLLRNNLKAKKPGQIGITDINEYIDSLTKIVDGGRRCGMITSRFLQFMRPKKIKIEDININQTIKDALSLVADALSVKRICIHKILCPDLPRFKGDKPQLQQVFINIILNAQQAMPQGGELTVASLYNLSDKMIEITFTDTGVGIPEQILQKVFDPFFTTRVVGNGTGLGLSVSYGLIREHGGTIDVQSQIGKGSTFTVRLPVKAERKSGKKKKN